MRTPVLFAVILLAVGCNQKSDNSAPPGTNAVSGSGNPMNAPADYLGALAKGQQQAVKTIDTASIDRAIQMFNVEKGRNPKDLDELVQEKYIPKIPAPPNGMKLVYDPQAGTVHVEKQ